MQIFYDIRCTINDCASSAQIQKMAADEEVLNQNTRLDLQ